MRRPQVGERERLLEQRRPAAAGGITDLASGTVHRDTGAPGHRRQLRRKADGGKERLERAPVDRDTHETPFGTALAFRSQCAAAIEGTLLPAHRPLQSEL